MNFNSVVFYNFFNNGDIHLSRGFIKYIMNKLSNTSLQFFYAHKKDPILLSDITNLKFEKSFFTNILNAKGGAFIQNNVLYVNTWYGSENYRFMNTHALSFDTLYLLFEDVCTKYFNFSLSETNPENLFPEINFDVFETSGVKRFVDRCCGPKLLVSNGHAQSGQSVNFNLGNVISELAEQYHGVSFILTNKEEGLQLRENMIYSEDIIKRVGGSDLNENAYLGLFCELLVGRASGIHSFCLNRENMFTKNNYLVSFSNLNYSGPYWLHDKFKNTIKYSATIKNFDISTSDQAHEIIDHHIKLLWTK